MAYQLIPAAVGPIIGHTSSHSSRVWIQAVAVAERRTVGVAALYDAAGKYVEHSVQYFRLPRRNDRTGVVHFSRLHANTSYRVRVAVLVQDAAYSHVNREEGIWSSLPPVESLLLELECLQEESTHAGFHTFAEDASHGMSFIFGSCRYPGLLWAARKSDRIFGSIHQQFRATHAPSFVLMGGDQIYADKLTRHLPLFRARSAQAFRARYVEAFTTRHMRALLREVPTYMILDDHEIEDGWNVDRLDKNPELYDNAMEAYQRYQWLHSPRNYAGQGEVEPGSGDKYFYSFECAGYPFFVLDSRTERMQHDKRCDLVENHMLGDPAHDHPKHRAQLPLLCEWLVRQQQLHGDRAKFIATPDMFAPNEIDTAGADDAATKKKCKDDAWAAFPATRRQLLQTIVNHGIQNVVFLSGDAHSSSVAEMDFVHKTEGKLPLRAYDITSSALYWPWPFARGHADDFVQDSALQNDHFDVNEDVVMQYKAYAFEQHNNFTRIDLNGAEMRVRNFNREGEALGETVLKLS